MPDLVEADIYQHFFAVNSLLVAVACGLLIWVCWQSYRQHRLSFLNVWAASWLSYLLARVITLIQVGPLGSIEGWTRFVLSVTSQTGYYLHVWLLVVCLQSLASQSDVRLRRGRINAVVAGLLVFTSVITVATLDASSDTRMLLRVGMRCGVTAMAFTACGALLVLHGRRIKRLGARLTGVALLFGALQYWLQAYAFSTGRFFPAASYLGSFEVLVVCSIGLGLVLWLHEDVNAKAQRINRELGERTQALLHAQRLESIGQLAGGIAHDFNNVLTVVLGNTDALLREDGLDESVRTSLQQTRHAAMHAAKMTGQLLTLARSPASALEVIDIGREAREILPLLRSLAGNRITVTFETPSVPLRTMLKRGHIEQILINFVTNGRDAIEGDGSIHIRAGRDTSDAPTRVLLSATDTGAGMPEAVRQRVGELFFTTKGGSGTGMGMASVRSILAETGGRLDIESEVGRGAVVTASWPEFTAGLAGPVATPRAPAARPTGKTILFAEDDVMVRNITRRTLETAGFQVLAPESSGDAAELASAHPGAIDLLLSDVVMPGLSGPELAARIRAARPGTTISFISGYIDDSHGAQLPEDALVLGKPFTREELLDFVKGALGGATATPREGPPRATISSPSVARAAMPGGAASGDGAL